MQTDVALLSADALLFGSSFGAASGDKGAFGFGARPWRNGSGAAQPVAPGQQPWNTAGRGDIDGGHLDFSSPNGGHSASTTFMFKPLLQRGHDPVPQPDHHRDQRLVPEAVDPVPPDGSQDGRRRRHGFEIQFAAIYSQAWYPENTPGLAKAARARVQRRDHLRHSDRLHAGLAYGLLLPFDGLRNTLPPLSPSVRTPCA